MAFKRCIEPFCSLHRCRKFKNEQLCFHPFPLPAVSTTSTQICSSPPLFRFLVFYPLVLFAILVAAFLVWHFKKKCAQKNKLNLWEEKTSVEAAEMVAPSHSKLSSESHNDIAEEETNRLKGNEED